MSKPNFDDFISFCKQNQINDYFDFESLLLLKIYKINFNAFEEDALDGDIINSDSSLITTQPTQQPTQQSTQQSNQLPNQPTLLTLHEQNHIYKPNNNRIQFINKWRSDKLLSDQEVIQTVENKTRTLKNNNKKPYKKLIRSLKFEVKLGIIKYTTLNIYELNDIEYEGIYLI